MLYFAYGSNMNLEHMRRLCGWHCRVLGMATLPDFVLGLDLRGYMNIVPKAGAKTVGVLFEADQHCLDVLDEFEGCPEVFMRQEVEVKDQNGQRQTAWVYLEKPEQFGGKGVKAEFMRRVIIGAEENHLPQEWIKFLKSFPQV